MHHSLGHRHKPNTEYLPTATNLLISTSKSKSQEKLHRGLAFFSTLLGFGGESFMNLR